jgi:WD40 repeat protein
MANSRALVSAAADGRLIVRDVKRDSRTETLENPTGGVSAVAIAKDGRTAYTAGQNGSLVAWDLSGARRLDRPFRVPLRRNRGFVGQVAPDVVASPGEETFAVPERTGYADLFDSRTVARTGRVRLSPGAYLAEIAIEPDGRTMAATTLDGRLALSDMHTHEPLGPPVRVFKGPAAAAARRGHHAFPLALSGDGRWLATSGSPSTVTIWDARRRKPITTLAVGGVVSDVTLSPNGATLAITVTDSDNRSGQLDVVSMPLLKPIAHVRVPVGEWGRFSRDGRVLLYGDESGRVWVFDTRTWRTLGQPLVGHSAPVLTVSLSPDGRTLATTSLDGTTRLWDVASRRTIGTALPGVPDHAVSAAFVDSGRGLVAVYDNGRGYLWDVRPNSWARRACEVAGRTLTRAEWQSALPERDYAPACAHR